MRVPLALEIVGLLAAGVVNCLAASSGFPLEPTIDHAGPFFDQGDSIRVVMITALPAAVLIVGWLAGLAVRQRRAGRRALRMAISFAVWSAVVTFSVAHGLSESAWVALLCLGAVVVGVAMPPRTQAPR